MKVSLNLVTRSVVLLLLAAACSKRPEVVIHTQAGTAVRVPVELALTPEARERGLMYRRDLAEGAGMLFVFPDSAVRSFWMKNTPLALDMIFIDDEGHIAGIVENAVPFSLVSRTVGVPSRYVLEVHAGFTRRHGVQAGDRVELPIESRSTR
jgi:uncharacterized membrane protein (UPF0127 family)